MFFSQNIWIQRFFDPNILLCNGSFVDYQQVVNFCKKVVDKKMMM